MYKKTLSLFLFLFIITNIICAQITIKNDVIIYDEYTVDNDFINEMVEKFKIIGKHEYQEYFINVVAMDVAVAKDGTYDNWGIAADAYYNFLYYFDNHNRDRMFGIDSDTGEVFIKEMGKVATTSDGMIYVSDLSDGKIYYWDKENEQLYPEGSLDKSFSNIQDICKDYDDNLYVLESSENRIYSYVKTSAAWKTYSGGLQYIDLNSFYSEEWGRPSGIIANQNGLYVSFLGGVIASYDFEGSITGYYWIDSANLGLASSPRRHRSNTWLVSITSDPAGNIFVADSMECKIHIFSPELEYRFSWEDSSAERPFERSVSEITFFPGFPNILIAYPWGFYSYKSNKVISEVSLSDDYVYPQYVNSQYTGIKFDASVMGKSGNLDIVARNGEDRYFIVDNGNLSVIYGYSHMWNGKDRNNNPIPYGEYYIEFYLDNELQASKTAEIKKKPDVTLLTAGNVILTESNNRIIQEFSLDAPAYTKIYITKDENGTNEYFPVSESFCNEGLNSVTIDINDFPEDAADGYYYIKVEAIPPELTEYNFEINPEIKRIALNKKMLKLSTVRINEDGLNPENDNMKYISANFDISESSFLTVRIVDESHKIIKTFVENVSALPGSKGFTWDGRNTNGIICDDGEYAFQVDVSQPETGEAAAKESSYFVLDTSSPVINIDNKQAVYYISPDEFSSVGVKDYFSQYVTLSEDAVISASVLKNSQEQVLSLYSAYQYDSSSGLDLTWNGKNEDDLFVDDGIYNIKLGAKDKWGNTRGELFQVVVDNNRSGEDSVSNGYMAITDQFPVNPVLEAEQISSKVCAAGNEFIVTDVILEETGFKIDFHMIKSNGNISTKKTLVDNDAKSRKLILSHDIATNNNNFVVAWWEHDLENDKYNIYARTFHLNGFPSREKLLVGSCDELLNVKIGIIMNKEGFNIIWTEGSSGNQEIFIKSYKFIDSGVTSVIRTLKSGQNIGGVDISYTEDGFVVVWDARYHNLNTGDENTHNIYAMMYNKYGDAAGPLVCINPNNEEDIEAMIPNGNQTIYLHTINTSPSVSSCDEGFIVTWTKKSYFISSELKSDICMRKYNSNALPLTDEIVVSSNERSLTEIMIDSSGEIEWNAVEIIKKGNSVCINDNKSGNIIVWSEITGDCSDIYARNYTSNGFYNEKSIVNSEKNKVQFMPEIAANDNYCLISWTLRNNPENANEDSIYARVFAAKYDDFGNNLNAKILSPEEENYTAYGDFAIAAIASDINIDKYELSIQRLSGKKDLIAKSGLSANGDMYYFNILEADLGVENTVNLEVWDKAGNYRSDQLSLLRVYESIIDSYEIGNYYVSDKIPLQASFRLKEACNVMLKIMDENGNTVKTADIGSISDTDNFEINTEGMTDGKYYLCLQTSHDVYPAEESRIAFTRDNSPPQIELNMLKEYYSHEDEVKIPLKIEEENLHEFRVALTNKDGSSVNVIMNSSNINDAGNICIYPKNIDEGSYNLVITAEDSVKNKSRITKAISIDRTPPQMHFASPDYNVVQGPAVEFSGYITDNVSGAAEYTINYKDSMEDINICRGTYETILPVIWDASGIRSEVMSGDIICNVKDKAGNSASYNWPIVIDVLPPETSVSYTHKPFETSDKKYINADNKLIIHAESNDDYSYVSEIYYKIASGDWQAYEGPLSFQDSGTYSISYYAVDSNRNESAAATENVIIDADCPEADITIGDPMYIGNGYTYIQSNNNISLDASDGDGNISSGLLKVEYRINDDIWDVYDNGVKVYKQGTAKIQFRLTDNVENQTILELDNLMMDILPPVTEYTIDKDYYRSYQRNIIAVPEQSKISFYGNDAGEEPEASGINRTMVFIDGAESENSEDIIIDSTTPKDFVFYSVDNVGNVENSNSVKIAIDNIPPDIALTWSDNVYISEDIVYALPECIFSLDATDNFAGVRGIYYSLDSAEYIDYEEGLSWNYEKQVTFEYFADDCLGQKSMAESVKISIDDSAPETQLKSNIPVIEINGEFYADERYLFSMDAEDSKCGVAETFIYINGEVIEDDHYNLPEDGVYTITFFSVDNLGNREEEKTITITTPIPDTTPPVSTLNISESPFSADGMEYYRSSVVFDISAEDIYNESETYASGVKAIYYSIDGKAFEQYAEGKELSFEKEGFHSIVYYSVDNLENEESEKSYSFTIDDNPPESNLVYNKEKTAVIDSVLYITTDDIVEIIAVDELSGVRKTFYSVNEEDFVDYSDPLSFSNGDYIFRWYSVDNLDNTEETRIQKIHVVNDYEIQSFDTMYINNVNREVPDFEIINNKVVFIGDSGRCNVYSKPIEYENDNLYYKCSKLNQWANVKTQIAFSGKWVAVIEELYNSKSLILYDVDHSGQYGIPVSLYADNSDPVFSNGKLFWIKKDSGYYSIMKYNPEERRTDLVYESTSELKKLKYDNGGLTFITVKPNSQEICRVVEEGIETEYTTDNDVQKEILDYSINPNYVALEYCEESLPVELYKRDDAGTLLIYTKSAKVPKLGEYYLYYIESRDNLEVLVKHNILTGNESNIIVSAEIMDYRIDDEDILVFRKKLFSWRNPAKHNFFKFNHGHRNRLDDLWNKVGSNDFVFFRKAEAEELVKDISVSGTEESFVYNKYLDQEDSLFANGTATVPWFILDKYDFAFQQIQLGIEASDKTEGELTFTAEKDMSILVLGQLDITPNNHHERNHNKKDFLFGNVFRKDYNFLYNSFRYNTHFFYVKKGETFSVKYKLYEGYPPVIYIMEKIEF